ncbi:MAG: hypothetical protein QXI19_12950 [Candidatus Caldarchaeum sp.]
MRRDEGEFVGIGICLYCGKEAAIPSWLYGTVVPFSAYICSSCGTSTPLAREKKFREIRKDEV